MKIPRCLLVAVLAACSPALVAADYSLTVNVSGAKPDTGQAICSLFSSAQDYLKEPVQDQVWPVDSAGKVTCRFSDLTAGRYAVGVVYDKDSNGELNTGFMGIPTELVGFSNNAKGMFGPPPFKKTSFQLSQDMELEVRLTNAKD